MSNKYPLTPAVSTSDHHQGGSDAKLSLVEYGDFQCSYCGQAYHIVKQIQKDFGDQLDFVFRNFPLAEIHQHAFRAAEAAELAGDQGKFWEMHDKLYENQSQLDEIHLVKYATDLGMDPKAFVVALGTDSKTAKIKADFMSGAESGVNGTPSFFING